MAGKYSAEKRAAVIADVVAGNTTRFVAEKHGVPRFTVRAWVNAAKTKSPAVASALFQLTPEVLGSQVDELLVSNLESLRAIDAMAQDKTWLKRQDAGQLAILYGVLYDKTERVLAARRSSARTDEAG